MGDVCGLLSGDDGWVGGCAWVSVRVGGFDCLLMFENRSFGCESSREIVSFRSIRACERAVWFPYEILFQKKVPTFSLFPFAMGSFSFSLRPLPLTSYPTLVGLDIRLCPRYIRLGYIDIKHIRLCPREPEPQRRM